METAISSKFISILIEVSDSKENNTVSFDVLACCFCFIPVEENER